MQEFDCLDPKTMVTGHHFLEASAGTGKTFAIEHIVLRLVAENEYALSEILAVTFTKAAARDLKARILATLKKAYQKSPSERLEKALHTLHELQVFTLHGFCYQALSKHALETGFPLNAASPDESNHAKIVVQLMRDFFRTEISLPHFSGIQFSMLLKKYSLQGLENKLLPLVTGSADLPDGVLFGEYAEKVKNMFDEVDTKKLIEDIYALTPFYKGICSRDGSVKPEYVSQIEFIKSPDDFEKTLLWKTLLFSLFTKSNEKKKGPPYTSSEMDRIVKVWPPLFREVTDNNALFCTLASKMRAWIKKSLGNNGVITPDSILEEMLKASTNEVFQEHLRKEYRAIIIDEFQDTDPMQWEIFRNIFYNSEYEAPTFYVVGDPKQSIYSFRNADIHTYLQARDAFSEKSLRSLSTNYRSAQSVIEGLNALFMHPAVAQMPTPYCPVKVGSKAETIDDEKKGVHFCIGDEKNILIFLANEIKILKTDSCAVLVRDRFEAEKVRELLLQAGIPSVMRHHGLVTESIVFTLIKYIIAVARDPFSQNELKRLATHPLVGFTAQDLVSEEWPHAARTLQGLHGLLKETGLLKTIDAFMHYSFKEETPLERLVEGMQLELWGDYLQLTELLFSGYTIEELERLGKKGDAKVLKRPFPRSDAVTIMTMHLSKGLEFDVVFALGVSRRFMPKDPLLRLRNTMVKNEDGEQCRAALHEMQEEKLRQLYVALTRAKRRLYVPLIENEPIENEYGLSPLEVFLKGNFEKIACDLESVISFEYVGEQTLSANIPSQSPCSGGVVLDTSIVKRETALSFSALARPHTSLVREVLPTELPPGSETGTFFHMLFERIIEEALYYPYDEKKIADLIARKAVHTTLEPFVSKIEEVVKQAFYIPLHVGVRLVDIPPERLLPEIEFFYTESGVTYKGVIDLLFFHGNEWYVLDWKTTLLASYTNDGMSRGMEEHDYFLQAKMYAHATKEYQGGHFGGVYYVFLRGLEEGKGVFFCEA